jgi:hypothetical protein
VNHVTEYDGSSAAARCRVAVGHIGDVTTAISRSDLAHFQKLTPQLTLALTLGSGHALLPLSSRIEQDLTQPSSYTHNSLSTIVVC